MEVEELKVSHLPDDHFFGSDFSDSRVSVFDYHSKSSCLKSKITLNQNIFSFLLEGSKVIYAGQEHESIDNRKFLMISAGNCLMTEKISFDNGYRSVLLYFDRSMVSEFININQIVIRKSAHLPFCSIAYDEYILSFVQSILKTGFISDSLLPAFLKNKLFELLYYLVSKIGPSFLYSFLAVHSSGDEQFKEIIEKNCLKKLSVEELAFLNNMSLSTFKRTFNKIYHTTPGKWFLKQRLQFAALMLTREDKRPVEIYEELGFESLSSFIHAFKTEHGTTPGQFQS